MGKKLRYGLSGVLLAVLFCAGVIGWLYRSTRSVPTFYQEALELDEALRIEASQEMGSRAATLYNDIRKQGQWHALFTADQVNGWLAVDLAEQHPNLLSPKTREPRVALLPGRLVVGFQLENNSMTTVFSIEVGLYVDEPNVMACRIYGARLGTLPLPLKRVLEEIANAAQRIDLPLRWAQSEGDPVALFTIPPQRDQEDNLMQLETIELHQGKIYLSGHTENLAKVAIQDNVPDLKLNAADHAIRKAKRQR